MYTSDGANIIVAAKDIWKTFLDAKEELLNDMITVAENDDFDVVIYLTNNNGVAVMTVESSNISEQEFELTAETWEDVVREVYDTFLTDKFISFAAEEAAEAEENYEEDMEFIIDEREADIDCFFQRLLEDLIPDDQILYTDGIEDVLEDLKEHTLEYLYRMFGISVYRPMELEDEDGVFIEDYPYDCMEFEPCVLYDDFVVTDLAITGKDILAMDVPQGKEVGELLDKAVKLVVSGIVPNDKDKLIACLKAIK